MPIRCTKPQLPLFIPWCAGDSRHGRLVGKHVLDSDPGWIPAPADDTNHRHPTTTTQGRKRNVALGVVPSKNHPAGRQTSAENTRRSPAVPAESLPQCYHYETNVRSIPPPDVGPARGAALCGNREDLGGIGRLPQDRLYKRKNAKQKLRRHAAGYRSRSYGRPTRRIETPVPALKGLTIRQYMLYFFHN